MEDRRIGKKIDFKIDGLDEDQGTVRLSVFKEKLDQLTKILADAERQAAHVNKAKSLFFVSDLKYSSAYTQIEPFEESGYVGSIQAVELFECVIDGIDSEAENLGGVQSSLVKKIQDICKGDGERFKRQTLSIAGKSLRLDADLAAKAQKYLDKKYECYGEIKGVIERVNIHNRNDFVIYLDINGGAVECHFKESELLKGVRESLGKTVIARGKLRYIGSDIHPCTASVDELEMIPDDFSAPTMDDFFGVAPNISGDMDVVDYIRKYRGDWELH